MTPRGRGASAILLSLALAACVDAQAPSVPRITPAPGAAAAIARDASSVLVRISAYDYALAGALAGERVQVVTPERYAVALENERQAILGIKDRVLQAAFADAALAAALVEMADASVRIAGGMERYAATREESAFVAIVTDVGDSWASMRRLATRLPRDERLQASIARGTAWTIVVTTEPAFSVITAPFATRDEAQRAAERIGSVEQIPATSPFAIRVLTTTDRVSAEKRVAELQRSEVLAAVVDTERYRYKRGGPDAGAELWREPAVDIPTWNGARRANFVAGGIVVVSVDGETFGFDEGGRPVWHAKLQAGPSFVTPAAGGRFVLVGGLFANLLTSDGRVLGTGARLPSAAAAAVWLERRQVFVAASQGPTGKADGGPGAVNAIRLDATALGAPFPLVTPAAGPALATSPARDEVFVATTSAGTTDVEVIRPGLDERPRTIARISGQVQELLVDDAGTYAVLVTVQGTYRFRVNVADPAATIERIGAPARDIAFAPDGTLYLMLTDRLVAYDAGLRALWTLGLADGRRVLVGRRVVVQDGLRRTLVVDAANGESEELASLGEVEDAAVSPDGARLLLLVEGRRAVLFTLP